MLDHRGPPCSILALSVTPFGVPPLSLIHIFIVRFCGRSAHNYAAFMDVPRTEWEHWANADSAIVHADFRGNGLQRLMLEAALPLFPKKITHIGATVSPQNQYSLHNALASGFAIVSRREMYGGHDRYLLAKEL